MCKACQKIASISHILGDCLITKKKQMKRHEFVCHELWKSIMEKHHIKGCNKCDYVRTEDIEVIRDKDIIPRNIKMNKRPDLTYFIRDSRECYLIEVTIVSDRKIESSYRMKIERYEKLQRWLHKNENMSKVKIIPIIITYGGLINYQSRVEMDDIGLYPNWKFIMRNVVIDCACTLRQFIVNFPNSYKDADFRQMETYKQWIIDSEEYDDGTDDSQSLLMSE